MLTRFVVFRVSRQKENKQGHMATEQIMFFFCCCAFFLCNFVQGVLMLRIKRLGTLFPEALRR